MKKILLVSLVGLSLSAGGIIAEQALPTNGVVLATDQLGWDEAAASLADANKLLYKLTVDQNPAVILTRVVCTGSVSPFACQAPWPLLSVGSHNIFLVAADGTGFESQQSSTYQFNFGIIPAAPGNLRNVKAVQLAK